MQEAAMAIIRITDSRDMMECASVTERAGNALKRIDQFRKSEMETTKMIPVQFNPSTLTFAYTGGDTRQEEHTIGSILQEAGKNRPQVNGRLAETAYTVSMKLIFDNSYQLASVQPEVEIFLELLKNPYLNSISFCWGTLFFAGSLESVNAEYVMFDETGRPVRANVQLTLKVAEI